MVLTHHQIYLNTKSKRKVRLLTDIDKNSKLFDVDIFDVIKKLQRMRNFPENLIESDQKLLRQVIQEEERKEKKKLSKSCYKGRLRKYKDGKVAGLYQIKCLDEI